MRFMRIIALSTLKKFWESSPIYADSIEPGISWYRETLKADWSTRSKGKVLKRQYPARWSYRF